MPQVRCDRRLDLIEFEAWDATRVILWPEDTPLLSISYFNITCSPLLVAVDKARAFAPVWRKGALSSRTPCWALVRLTAAPRLHSQDCRRRGRPLNTLCF